MRERRAGTHLRGDPDRLHQFLVRGALAERGARVALDAIRTLRDVRSCHGDEVLGSGRKRALGEDCRAKIVECTGGTRRELLLTGEIE